MATMLQQTTDPMDANLETVMPGVHQWHQVTNESIKAQSHAIHVLDEKFEFLVEWIDEGLTRVVDHLDENREAPDRRLASTFLNIAQDLLYSSGSRQDKSATVSPISINRKSDDCTQTSPNAMSEEDEVMTAEQQNLTKTEGTTVDKQSAYRMVKKHKTLDDMWDEWHGVGHFEDAVGGIKGRNKQFGAKWRRHLEGQHYSRTKHIVEAIAKYAEDNKLKIREACAIMNDWYTEATVSQSLTKMKQLCINKGLLKKGKQRGKHCRKVAVQADTHSTTAQELMVDQ